jgi:hypothetical protein
MLRSLGIIAILVPTTLPALATSERGNEDLRRYCAGDATTFCGGVAPDGKEMDACFKPLARSYLRTAGAPATPIR